MSRDVLVTGGTGYVGQRLVRALTRRGHRVRVLTRAESAARVPDGAAAIVGDALDARSYAPSVVSGGTIVHLVGTPHPSPAKAAEFRRVDLPSVQAAVVAAAEAGAHLVYISVAHPAPVMHAYIAARVDGERAIADARVTATVLRPWYILGPGHRWPLALLPLYGIAWTIPSMRDGAQRLGLVTLRQMVDALVSAVENPPAPHTIRLVEVPEIRRGLSASIAV
jgi:uncharacterized protein YbjT (DUF2867 family)